MTGVGAWVLAGVISATTGYPHDGPLSAVLVGLSGLGFVPFGGGALGLANTVLLCSRHHTIVHSQGFTLVLHPDRTLDVTTADGVPIRHLQPLPWQPANGLDPDSTICATTLPPTTNGDRLDLDYVVAVLLQQAA